jgi:hypothetical protein
VPIEQLPDSPGAATNPPNERLGGASEVVPAAKAEPAAPDQSGVPPGWTLIDSIFRLSAYVLDDDARVARLLRILTPVAVLAVFGILLVLTSDGSIWIKLGVPTLGVALSSGFFAYRRWRKSR